MKRTSAALKLIARKSLDGKYGTPMAALLLLGMCTLVPSFLISSTMDTSSAIGIITSQILVYMVSLLVAVISAGYSKLMLNIERQNPFSVKDLGFAFSHHPDRFIIVHLILLLVQFIICLPFDLPVWLNPDLPDQKLLLLTVLSTLAGSLTSLILGLFFGLADYLLLDITELSALDALKESTRLMKGNKGRYFYINLSFLPLYLASFLTCYIGLLWLMPYIRATMAVFYMDVTGELDVPVSDN
ncbi:MAG: DUF975 family protein [Blautia sp.]